jgi:hypothetical protein
MNDELGRIWKEIIVILMYYPSIILRRLGKIMINLYRNSWTQGQQSTPEPHEYRAR